MRAARCSLQVAREGRAEIRVDFFPSAPGVHTAQLNLFWEDGTHTTFVLQAFVGQPLQVVHTRV